MLPGRTAIGHAASFRPAGAVLPIALAFALGCWSGAEEIHGCDGGEGLRPRCGFVNPEDVAPLSTGAWLAVSQYVGAASAGGGSIVAFRVSDGERRLLYPPAADAADLSSREPMAGWGSKACPGPPDPDLFSPHGIDVRASTSGLATLAAVNHGREAIELFEVGYAAGGPALGWRGCVPLPPEVFANDVVLPPGKGLLVTNMLPRPEGVAALSSLVRMLLGLATGSVLEWQSDEGWRVIEGSSGSGPNGIAISHDGREIYFTEWSGGRLVRLMRDGTGRPETVDLPHMPDNITWSRDGRLLVTGQVARLGEALDCGEIKGGTCALPFSVIAVDPVGLDADVVLEHGGTVTGAASVALDLGGGSMIIGTFAGDRLVFAPSPR